MSTNTRRQSGEGNREEYDRAARERKLISREMLEFFFARIRDRACWSIDGVCLWQFYFTHHDRQRLLAAAAELEQTRYQVAGIMKDEDADDETLLCLHVEREEQHTVDTLEVRTREFYNFAEEFGVTYQGMGV